MAMIHRSLQYEYWCPVTSHMGVIWWPFCLLLFDIIYVTKSVPYFIKAGQHLAKLGQQEKTTKAADVLDK